TPVCAVGPVPGRGLAARPGRGAAGHAAGPVRLPLGDFTATLDHGPLRDLLGSGYRDAASVVDAGFTPTCPYDGRTLPKTTIDHVLASRRIGVRDVSAYTVLDTDHRALFAALTLP